MVGKDATIGEQSRVSLMGPAMKPGGRDTVSIFRRYMAQQKGVGGPAKVRNHKAITEVFWRGEDLGQSKKKKTGLFNILTNQKGNYRIGEEHG